MSKRLLFFIFFFEGRKKCPNVTPDKHRLLDKKLARRESDAFLLIPVIQSNPDNKISTAGRRAALMDTPLTHLDHVAKLLRRKKKNKHVHSCCHGDHVCFCTDIIWDGTRCCFIAARTTTTVLHRNGISFVNRKIKTVLVMHPGGELNLLNSNSFEGGLEMFLNTGKLESTT